MPHRPKLDRLALAAVVLALSACSTQTKPHELERVAPPQHPAPLQQIKKATPPPVQPIATPANGGVSENFIATAGDRVYFDIDRAVLKPAARETLNRQIKWLKRHPDAKVRIEGNADITGTSERNMSLGQRRADAVKNYLIAHGIAASRISTLSHGQTRPANLRRSVTAFAQNRSATTVLMSTKRSR
jgi:peptidoglycan-associated lipoprotein